MIISNQDESYNTAQLNQKTTKFSQYLYPRRETCLLQRGFSQVWSRFMESVYPVSTDRGGTWYPQTCAFLKIDHHVHSPLEKSLIERKIQYVKYRTESFDDYFPCYKKHNCKLEHIKQWIKGFAYHHNNNIIA